MTWSVVDSDEVEWAEPSPERERLTILGQRLMSLASWLPADAWVDARELPYVPASYRLFIASGPWGGNLDDLPPEASSVAWPLAGDLLTNGEEVSSSSSDYRTRCAVIGRAEAERVATAIAAISPDLRPSLGEQRLASSRLGDRDRARYVDVLFEALAPHDTECSGALPPGF